MALEPGSGRGFRYDREYLDRLVGHIVEDPNLPHAQSVLGPSNAPQALDPAPARLRWLMPQVLLERISDRGSIAGLQRLEILLRLGGQDDLPAHSGQNLARIRRPVKDLHRALNGRRSPVGRVLIRMSVVR